MSTISTVAVYCGSSAGTQPVYCEKAAETGRLIAGLGMGIIYGGAKVGVMGAVADGALQAGGRVTGILPHFLEQREVAHHGLTELIMVETMHERKLMMYEKADAILALPGGFGTMEELFEMLTWAQLGLHQKPIGLLNTGGFYDPLLALAQTMLENGFIREAHRHIFVHDTEPAALLEKIKSFRPPQLGKLMTRERI
ncbi:MAG: TIGR00730 family Rossman fold protein [Balneolales bacterium]|nr:TIGR00730 family Rossman fold protein [Balneolales bacterium]